MSPWNVSILLASATVSSLCDTSDRQDFLLSLIPAVVSTLVALVAWSVANRRPIRERRVGLRSILVLIGLSSPGLAMLRWAWWPFLR